MADAATTFAGIHNENEFYSHHYLSEIFTGEIRDTVARWRDSAEAAGGASAGARTPYEALRALARDYLQFRRQFALARRHEARVGRQRRWFAQLLDAFGYGYEPHNHPLEDGDEVPVLFAGRQHGSVSLLILGAYYGASGEDEDPLDLKPHSAQYHGEAPPPEALLRESWSDIVTRRIFGQPHPPRWIILLSPGHVILIERGKWTHRLLRFEPAAALRPRRRARTPRGPHAESRRRPGRRAWPPGPALHVPAAVSVRHRGAARPRLAFLVGDRNDFIREARSALDRHAAQARSNGALSAARRKLRRTTRDPLDWYHDWA